MITGFNTDVKLADTVYHVQTEDKGTANPLIESLIYVKGAILESYRTYYATFLNSDNFKEGLLQRILESQHRQIVGSIRKGKYRKGMQLEDFVDGEFVFNFQTPRVSATTEPLPVVAPAEDVPEKPLAQCLDSPVLAPDARSDRNAPIPFNPVEASSKASFLPTELDVTPAFTATEGSGIEIVVKGSKEFKAGNHVELDLFVQTRHDRSRLENVQVLVKVIGTTFTPRLYAGKTDKTGNLRMTFSLPTFSAGSAALILQATTSAGTDEIKYLIKRR
jgi:hypothetical protein